jgi:hypothetical protein
MDITIEELKQMLALIEEVKGKIGDTAGFDKFRASVSALDPVLSKLRGRMADAAKGAGKAVEALQGMKASDVTRSLSNATAEIKNMAIAAGLSSKSIELVMGNLAAVGAASKFDMSSGFVQMGVQAKDSSANISEAFSDLSKFDLGGPINKVVSVLEGMSRKTDHFKKMETGLLMTAAASGNLNVAVQGLGQGYKNLGGATVEFARMTANVGTANNLTAGQVAGFAKQMMKIPDAMNQVITNVDGSNTSMKMLDATLKVSAGTFQDFSTVMADVEKLYKQWGKTGEESLEFVSKMHKASQSLKMPMDDMRGYVEAVGKQFLFLGDNTQGAIEVMMKMQPALRDSKLGPQAISSLVQGMTKSVADMDLAQRAFVSAQTGGPGGLQGGYQMALQMQEGDTVGVMSKVEDTLRNMFGGQIMTLEEGSKDAASAAQLAKQVAMLTSGPMKMAGSEAEAFKILEAMSKGKVFTPEEKTTPKDALSEVVKTGNTIQERQHSRLLEIKNAIEVGQVAGTEKVYDFERRLTGTLGLGGAEDPGKRAAIRETRKGASYGAFRGKFMTGQVKSADQLRQEMISSAKSKVGGFMGDILNKFGFDYDKTPKADVNKAKKAEDMRRPAPTPGAAAGGPAHRGTGKEHTVVIQVRSDDEIKKVVRAVVKDDEAKIMPTGG